MTTKNINLRGKKTLTEIETGTVVKNQSDLFIVSKVSREVSPQEQQIHGALFSTTPHTVSSRSIRRQEAKYALISLSTGVNFFDGACTLTELFRQVVDNGRFEVVRSIDIDESL